MDADLGDEERHERYRETERGSADRLNADHRPESLPPMRRCGYDFSSVSSSSGGSHCQPEPGALIGGISGIPKPGGAGKGLSASSNASPKSDGAAASRAANDGGAGIPSS